MNPVAALFHYFRRKKRVRELRSLHLQNLRAAASTRNERVRYHFEHLALYWNRCLGFLAQHPAEPIIAGDLFACVFIGTETATEDIRNYCAEHARQPLWEAWQRYERQVLQIKRGVSTGQESLRTGAGAFDSVRYLYIQAAKAT